MQGKDDIGGQRIDRMANKIHGELQIYKTSQNNLQIQGEGRVSHFEKSQVEEVQELKKHIHEVKQSGSSHFQ